MRVGCDRAAPVTSEYQPPFRHAGRIDRVIVDVSGDHIEDHQAR